jgi:hypothetical protein
MLGIVVSSVEIKWHGGHSVARCFTLKLLEAYDEFVKPETRRGP